MHGWKTQAVFNSSVPRKHHPTARSFEVNVDPNIVTFTVWTAYTVSSDKCTIIAIKIYISFIILKRRFGFDSFKKRLWDKRTMLTAALLFGLITWQNTCLSECLTEMISERAYSKSGICSDGNNEIKCLGMKQEKSNQFPENSWFFVFNSTIEGNSV